MSDWCTPNTRGVKLMSTGWASGCDWMSKCDIIRNFVTDNEFVLACRQNMAYESNKLEGVCSGNTPAMWLTTSPPDVSFAVEGEIGESGRVRQLFQYDLALQHLNASDLTFDTLKEAHRIMLCGAEATDQHACDPGITRTTPAHAGTFSFPQDSIPDLVNRVLDRFNAGVETNPIFAAADVAVGVVSVHPFTNGNGRLCRLVFAAALMKRGFPVPVVLSNGHKRAFKHYISALTKVQTRDDYSEMYALAVASVLRMSQIMTCPL